MDGTFIGGGCGCGGGCSMESSLLLPTIFLLSGRMGMSRLDLDRIGFNLVADVVSYAIAVDIDVYEDWRHHLRHIHSLHVTDPPIPIHVII